MESKQFKPFLGRHKDDILIPDQKHSRAKDFSLSSPIPRTITKRMINGKRSGLARLATKTAVKLVRTCMEPVMNRNTFALRFITRFYEREIQKLTSTRWVWFTTIVNWRIGPMNPQCVLLHPRCRIQKLDTGVIWGFQ